MVRTSTDEAAVASKLLSAIKAGEYVEGKTRSSDDVRTIVENAFISGTHVSLTTSFDRLVRMTQGLEPGPAYTDRQSDTRVGRRPPLPRFPVFFMYTSAGGRSSSKSRSRNQTICTRNRTNRYFSYT